MVMKNLSHFRTFTFFLILIFYFLIGSAQQLIDNKGNRNQSYPVVTETKPEIVSLINLVSQDSIENHIRYMQQFRRTAYSPAALTVQKWLIDHFESYGYEDIETHNFSYPGYGGFEAGNIVVIKKGLDFPDEYIMITSHYDHPDGPGADDNASGTAGVLECARLLKDFDTKRSIMFVTFNAEELWMVGSMPFAQRCAAENMNIIAHFNMDMIGWFPPDDPNIYMASGYSYISKALFEYYEKTANIYIPNIPTKRLSKGDSYGGDHMPFNIFEYPSLYIGDIDHDPYTGRPCYHKECDTIGIGVYYAGFNNLNLAEAFVQATLSATAELANAWLPPQNLSARSSTNKITVSWDGNNESSSYKVFKNNEFLIETTETFYEDSDVELNKKYEYYVIATNNGKETAPSNIDSLLFVETLQLPYFNGFSENKYGFEQSDWVLRKIATKNALCNSENGGVYDGIFPHNYLTVAELDWFSIPNSSSDISIRFKWRGEIKGSWNNTVNYFYGSAGLFFEVTNDRKTWHKLAYLSGTNNDWKNIELSLNEYKGSDFFQARFRLESSGEDFYGMGKKLVYITDVEVDSGLGIDDPKIFSQYISSFHFAPNPASSYINITTNQQEPYHIAIYDMTGKLISEQAHFQDGQLSVAHLRAGNYFIVASTKQHRVAKKLVIR